MRLRINDIHHSLYRHSRCCISFYECHMNDMVIIERLIIDGIGVALIAVGIVMEVARKKSRAVAG